jgi:site-specific DNA-cytosine methylase
VAGALTARSGKGANSTVDDGAMVIQTSHSQLPAQPGGGGDPALMTVRRLTPRECERLQGFPDDWTALDANRRAISDTARYRAIGNAVAVPVIAWIGRCLLAADHCHAYASCRPRRSNPAPISTADALEVPRA